LHNSFAALALLPAHSRLRATDLAIVAAYLIGITLFGLRFREKSADPNARSLRSYFLANNTIPWWAISLSIVSAETSTLTIISIPGVAFAGDFGFLQVVIGYMLGRIVVALLFLPRYFSGNMLTAYQLIDQRFGRVLHKVTAALFLLTRAAAEGVRVFAVSIVVGIAIGTRDVLSIAIISALTLLYTFEGGMAAVIWTDVVQMAIYIGGTFVAIWSLGHHVPGGWTTIHTVAAAAGKFHMLNFAFNLTTTYTFWAGVLGGTFLTMASHGTDQLMVQRMLAARNLRESQLALLSSGVIIFIQFALFLLIGAGLYVFAQQAANPGAPFATNPGAPFMAKSHLAMSGISGSGTWIQGLSPDRIFPTFIVREMPLGIAGLLVAAILAAAMSNLSAALNSLSSTTVVDFYMHLRPSASDKERNLIAKSSTLLWALVLFAIAVYALSVGGKGHVVEIGLSIASVAYGCLLGVFLLGTLTKFATQTGATLGMLCGFLLNLWLWQGSFPVHLGPLTIPHIAWTWYVLIGAIVTFALGSLFSLLFRKQSKRTAAVTATMFIAVILSGASRLCDAQSKDPRIVQAQVAAPAPAPDFTQISTLLSAAVATHRPPGAVVLIGHNNHIVFEQAYGVRKLAGEPGLSLTGPAGQPSPAEPMTEDTIFDMASLSKCLSTATAIMQLYEAGKITSFNDPLEKYLPAFNEQHDPTRAKVTLRMLLTHTSGEAPDVNLKTPWGLAAPDKAEGIHLALTTPLKAAPGDHFEYSDVNFILLGDLVETLSGEPLDVYAQTHIFKPLGMTDTRYLPLAKACGPQQISGSALSLPAPKDPGAPSMARPYRYMGGNVNRSLANWPCHNENWSTSLLPRIAPTAHDNEGTPATNPDFDRLLRGTVHDPTTRRMGGVAGHAGVFSTAHDVSLFAQALLEKLLHNTGPFPLKQSTLQLMTRPQQPTIPGAPHLDSEMWASTELSDANAAQADAIADAIADATKDALSIPVPSKDLSSRPDPEQAKRVEGAVERPAVVPGPVDCNQPNVFCDPTKIANVRTGIDVLESTHFAALANLHHIALLTNQTGLDAHGHRTIDILHALTTYNLQLTTLFSPEHGLLGRQDTEHLSAETDPTTGLHVTSLFGPTDADKRPSHAQLKDLDAVVIDLQDAGVRFWTYEAATAYFLEAASREQTEYHHDLEIILLDRPNPLGGLQVQGPVSDPGLASYIDYMPLPVRHGLTLGELSRYIVATKHLATHLTVVPMQHWQRTESFADTGLPWISPSPNLRSLTAATLYPALGFLDYTNISVGRGTPTPFELFAAAWFNAPEVAAALTARHIPGVTFAATPTTVADDANHYPFHGQTIPAVRITLTARNALDSPELGIEILSILHRLYPTQFQLDRTLRLLGSRSTLEALQRGDDPRSISLTWTTALDQFKSATAPYLLYP